MVEVTVFENILKAAKASHGSCGKLLMELQQLVQNEKILNLIKIQNLQSRVKLFGKSDEKAELEMEEQYTHKLDEIHNECIEELKKRWK